MNERMHIVCATDNNYVALCGIMLTSLFENNRHCPISVYILTEGLKPEHCKRLKAITDTGKYNAEINICVIDSRILKNCVIAKDTIFSNIFTNATFYRFLIPDILPRDCEKALYLDCDIVVDGDISELYDTDITDVALAAVPEHDGEIGELDNSLIYQYIDNLRYPRKYGYFNAGVILININYWRKYDVEKRLISFYEDNAKICKLYDQDALNGLLYKEKSFLPYKYNVMSIFFDLYIYNKDYTAIFLKERPIIIHYCTSVKPWNHLFINYPFKKRWKYYRNMSLWKGWKGNSPIKKKLHEFLRKIKYTINGCNLYTYRSSWRKWE